MRCYSPALALCKNDLNVLSCLSSFPSFSQTQRAMMCLTARWQCCAQTNLSIERLCTCLTKQS